MAGRRLLEAAKLLNAASSVAKQHLTLRQQQLDLYTKTSTIGKAAKSQTDRVTLTAQAAIALAKRFNETTPSYQSPTEQWTKGDDTIPRAETVPPGQPKKAPPADGLEQDHHYASSAANATTEPVPAEDMEVKQEEAAEQPLPDGTIPPSDADVHARRKDSAHDLTSEEARRLQRKAEDQIPRIFTADHVGKETVENKDINDETFSDRPTDETTAYSSLPRSKIPKNTEDTQGGDEHVDNSHMNPDVFYSSKGKQEAPAIPSQEAVPAQESIPEGINTDVFHSPRTARMLGGRDKKGYGLGLHAATGTPIEKSPLTEGRDQDTFNVRISSQAEDAPILDEQKSQNDGPAAAAKDHTNNIEAATTASEDVCLWSLFNGVPLIH